MADTTSLRAAIFDYLYGAYPTDRPFESILNEALDNSETDVDVLDGADWNKGDILEVVETGEQMLVLSKSTNTLTVKRSYGTVAATAAADTGLIRKNPRFTIQKVDQGIKDTLNTFDSWGIHGFGVGSITLVSTQYYYELSETDLSSEYGVLSVYYSDTNTEVPVSLPFVSYSQLNPADSQWTQGRGLKLLSKGDRGTTDTIYFSYAQSLDFDTDIDTTAAKLEAPQDELVVLGAVTRAIGQTIIPATQDPGARTDRTTPPGQTSRDGRWFQREFFTKIRVEAARLAVIRKRVAPGSVRTQRAGRWRS